jgi:hypothetical protein
VSHSGESERLAFALNVTGHIFGRDLAEGPYSPFSPSGCNRVGPLLDAAQELLCSRARLVRRHSAVIADDAPSRAAALSKLKRFPSGTPNSHSKPSRNVKKT